MPADATIFRRFLNPVFIETGMWEGDGIQAALDAGFPRVISIDIAKQPFDRCTARFGDDSRVQLVMGDSSIRLREVLQGITEPVTFWLDAHYTGPFGGGGRNPVLDELRAILLDGWKPPAGTAILIDDLRIFQDGTWGVTAGSIGGLIERFTRESERPWRMTKLDGHGPDGRIYPLDILAVRL